MVHRLSSDDDIGDDVLSIADIGDDDGGGGIEKYEVGKQTMSFTIRFYSSVQSLSTIPDLLF